MNCESDHTFNWKRLTKTALHIEEHESHIAFPIGNFPTRLNDMPNPFEPSNKEGFHSNLKLENIPKLHEMLRHPSPSAMIDLFRRDRMNNRLPQEIKHKIIETSSNCLSLIHI